MMNRLQLLMAAQAKAKKAIEAHAGISDPGHQRLCDDYPDEADAIRSLAMVILYDASLALDQEEAKEKAGTDAAAQDNP